MPGTFHLWLPEPSPEVIELARQFLSDTHRTLEQEGAVVPVLCIEAAERLLHEASIQARGLLAGEDVQANHPVGGGTSMWAPNLDEHSMYQDSSKSLFTGEVMSLTGRLLDKQEKQAFGRDRLKFILDYHGALSIALGPSGEQTMEELLGRIKSERAARALETQVDSVSLSSPRRGL